MFREYTALWLGNYGESRYDCEIYLHFDKNGKLIRAYCWADDIPKKYKYLNHTPWEKIIKPRTTLSINPLFVNLSKQFILNNLTSLYLCEIDEEIECNDPYILNAFRNYPQLANN